MPQEQLINEALTLGGARAPRAGQVGNARASWSPALLLRLFCVSEQKKPLERLLRLFSSFGCRRSERKREKRRKKGENGSMRAARELLFIVIFYVQFI